MLYSNCILQVYVSECIDVEWVGYIIMAYAVSSSLGGFATGKLLGLVNYNIAALGNLAIHIAVMLFLIIWEREPNYAVIFTVPSIWGLCFGAWLTITISEFFTLLYIFSQLHTFLQYSYNYMCCI